MRLALLLLAHLFHVASLAPSLSLAVDDVGGFSISVDGTTWLRAAASRLHSAGVWSTSDDGSLSLLSQQRSEGQDKLGSFNVTELVWATRDGTPFITSFRDYSIADNGVPLIILEQSFPNGVSGTSLNDSQKILSAFPAFQIVEPEEPLGYLVYYNQMVGGMYDGTQMGKWSRGAEVLGGTMGGPVVLFNELQQEYPTSRALVMSPWLHPMATSGVADNGTYGWGLLGSIESIPVGYRSSTALFLGTGVNDAVRGFGAQLLKLHGKQPYQGGGERQRSAQSLDEKSFVAKSSSSSSSSPSSSSSSSSSSSLSGSRDFTLDTLGYYTDNGAYYYYKTEPGRTYEDTLIDFWNLKDEEGLPFRYLQLDSWWYYKDAQGGVKNWTARPDVFPAGLEKFHQVTGARIVAHNRYWSDKTDYAKQNGGNYTFIIEKDKHRSLPHDAAFWNFLFKQAKQWGLAVYEQDWLHNEWEGMDATLASATLARDWLLQMDQAAQDTGITIQYCMAYTRFALASAELPSVTQIRVSDDYKVDLTRTRPSLVNLYTGVGSMLAAALGLAPFKDVFWSTEIQPGNPYNATEPLAMAHAAVSSLTGGPVGPGDGALLADRSLIMRCCMQDGTLLKPSWPATPLDSYFARKAFSPESATASPSSKALGPLGEVWAAYSEVPLLSSSGAAASDFVRSWHVIALNVTEAYSLLPSDLRISETPSSAPLQASDISVTVRGHVVLRGGQLASELALFSPSTPLAIPVTGVKVPGLFHVLPLLSAPADVGTGVWALLGEWTIGGELGKWVPTSADRFASIKPREVEGGFGLEITITGAMAENVFVTVAAWDVLPVPLPSPLPAPRIVVLNCRMGRETTARLLLPEATCVVG